MRLLVCPHAYFSKDKKKILCKQENGELCVHVYYCHLKGYWKQSEHAFNCPAREDKGGKDA